MIRSNPPGAMVYVDEYEIGSTPVAVDFTYYGTRRIRLVKDGYETLRLDQPVRRPWYQIPPLDFVSENLVPGELRDNHAFSYTMEPQRVVPPDELLERATRLRGEAGASGVFRQGPLPTPGALPGGPPAFGSSRAIESPPDPRVRTLPPGGILMPPR